MNDYLIALMANAIYDERNKITWEFVSVIDPITRKHKFPWCLRDEFAIRCAEAAFRSLPAASQDSDT